MRGGEPALEARAAVSGEAVFVGREHELRVLGERLERALAGSGSLVLVAGDPGIGKTRTLAEFALAARAGGALTLWGSSFEGDWHPPYGPWVEALGEVVRSLDPPRLRQDLGRGAPVLARLLPELGSTLGVVPAVVSLSPEEERFRLFDAVAQSLVAVARRQRVVLVLDDLHWTDRDSLQLLAYCGRFVARGGLVLVGAYRDAPLDLGHPLADTLAVLCRQAGYEHLALGGLSRGEVADYLARANRQPPPRRSSAPFTPRPVATRSTCGSCGGTWSTSAWPSSSTAAGCSPPRSATPACRRGSGTCSQGGWHGCPPRRARCCTRPPR
jgi:predicted ATPase